MLKLAHFFYYISIDIPYLENNSFMDYSDIFNFFIPILIIVLILIVFIKMPLNIILISKIVNEDIKISLNLRYIFNIININIPIYPRRAKSKKKEIKSNKKKSIFKKNIKVLQTIHSLPEIQKLKYLEVMKMSYILIGIVIILFYKRKWQPTPIFLPRKSYGQRSLVGCRLWGRRVGYN